MYEEMLGAGKNCKKYIASERMKIAKDMLITTNMSVKQIAYELGFSSENLFIKFFIYH